MFVKPHYQFETTLTTPSLHSLTHRTHAGEPGHGPAASMRDWCATRPGTTGTSSGQFRPIPQRIDKCQLPKARSSESPTKASALSRHPDGTEYLFHQSACTSTPFDSMREGENVTFTVGQGPKGPRAENVVRA